MTSAQPHLVQTSSSAPVGRKPSALWWYGLLMLCPLVMFTVSYPLRENSNRLTDIGFLSEYEPAAFALYVAGIGALFLIYLLALRAAMGTAASSALTPVLVCGVAFAVVMGGMYPVNAIDLFIYAVRSRILTAYGENPHLATPRDFPDDPLMAFSSIEWSTTVSPYGPLWNLIAAPITAIADDNLLIALVGFKALAAVAVLSGGWLIGQTLRAGGLPVAAGVLLYLWNPLVLWEGIGNGHNDTVMIVPVLAAILAWSKRRDRWILPLLAAAALIKYVAALAIPLAVVAIWRRGESNRTRVTTLAWGSAFSLGVAVVAFAPFYDLPAMWSSIAGQGSIYLTSPAAVAINALRTIFPVPMVTAWISATAAALLAAFAALQLARVWLNPDRFPRATYESFFVLLLVATWNFRVWYLIWLVAMAAVLPLGWPAWRAIAWTAGGLAGYALFIWIWRWWGADFSTVQVLGVLLMTGPAVVVSAIELMRAFFSRGRRRPRSAKLPRPAPPQR